MFCSTREIVHDYPIAWFDVDHPASVDNWIGEVLICIVVGISQIEDFSGHPPT